MLVLTIFSLIFHNFFMHLKMNLKFSVTCILSSANAWVSKLGKFVCLIKGRQNIKF